MFQIDNGQEQLHLRENIKKLPVEGKLHIHVCICVCTRVCKCVCRHCMGVFASLRNCTLTIAYIGGLAYVERLRDLNLSCVTRQSALLYLVHTRHPLRVPCFKNFKIVCRIYTTLRNNPSAKS